MKKVKIEYIEETNKYAQAYSSGVKMSIISPEKKQLKPFFFCADYLNEVCAAGFTNEKKSIFGFSYDPKEDVVSNDNLEVLITSDSHDLVKSIQAAKKFLNGFERKIGLKLSKFAICDDHPKYKGNVILITADKRIKNTVLLLTAWRVVLRNSFSANKEKTFDQNMKDFLDKKNQIIGHGDDHQFKRIEKFLDYVKKDKEFVDYFDIENYELHTDIIHSYSGLQNFEYVYDKKQSPAAPWQKRIFEKIS